MGLNEKGVTASYDVQSGHPLRWVQAQKTRHKTGWLTVKSRYITFICPDGHAINPRRQISGPFPTHHASALR